MRAGRVQFPGCTAPTLCDERQERRAHAIGDGALRLSPSAGQPSHSTTTPEQRALARQRLPQRPIREICYARSWRNGGGPGARRWGDALVPARADDRFSNDVGHIGRLLLAHDGTWPINGDVTAELEHKLAESLWWTFVLADKLGVDIDDAFVQTMSTIEKGLEAAISRDA